jgi:hypothetical protein
MGVSMQTIRVKGVGLDKKGWRTVTIKGQYYGNFDSLPEANARARDVWRLYKLTGHLPLITEPGNRPIGQCELTPDTGQ